jgi:serine/threonine-protein kinase
LSGNFLEPPASTSSTAASHDDHYLGKHVGPYRIERFISHGGMGAVYEAFRDDGQFQKRVAIKLVRPVALSKELIERFHLERQTLARLDHPNIAGLLDGGTTDDGTPYLAMEFVDGVPIDEYCDSNKLSIDERLELFRIVCLAVQYAHQNLVVHRDIKPGNILVTSSGAPKLLDFGIAKFLNDAQQSEPSEATRVGLRFITLEYASPEQIKGEPITTTSDVYSLGVLLYKLLTGRSPYQFKSHLPHEITRVICEQEPLKPSTTPQKTSPELAIQALEEASEHRSLTPDKLRRTLAGDLDNILLKSLQKDPSRRYASVEQFVEDIRRRRDGLPVVARPDTLRYRTSKFLARHKLGVAATAMVALALFAGVAGVLWQARVAQREAEKSSRINAFLLRMLGSINPAEEGRDITVSDALDRAADNVHEELGNEPELEASVRKTLGTTYHGLGNYEKAHKQLAMAVATLSAQSRRNERELASAMHELGSVEQSVGNFSHAESLYARSIAIFRSVSSLERTPDLAQTLNDLGTLRGDARNDFIGAEQLFREALAMYERAYGSEHNKISETLANIAVALHSQKRLVEADSVYTVAMRMIKKLRGEDHMEYANVLSSYAMLLGDAGDLEGSERVTRQSLAIHERLLSAEHPDVAFTRLSLAKILIDENNTVEGDSLLHAASLVLQKSLPSNHPYNLDVALWRARSLNRQKRFAESKPILVNLIEQLQNHEEMDTRLKSAQLELETAKKGLEGKR